MSKLTLNVSKKEFENRLVAALEGAMKSPLSRKRNQILNAAMVQILHGGNGAGQNEHNLGQFWDAEPANNNIATIHTIIIKNKHEEADDGFDSVDIESTLSAEKHDARLLEIFSSYTDEHGGFDKDDLINHQVMQDAMRDKCVDDDEFDSMGYDEVIDWLKENGQPNQIIDIIPIMNYGLVEIEVKYEYSEI
jgi:hypothetical protein